MSASIPQVPVRPAVRALYRALAGLIGIAGVAAILGTALLAWRGARVPTMGDIMMLPLLAWFMRLMFHAALYGEAPADGEYWPLASRGVWEGYIFLLIAYWIFNRH
jgi:hypothetical protein